MSIVGIIIVIALVCLIVYVAPRLPAPWPTVAYAVVVIACLLGLLSMFGLLGSTVVIR